jgi:hypothetical protein
MRFPWYIWIPRVLLLAVCGFMMLFSFDVFETKAPLGEHLLGFFMHNIPVWILLLMLIFTWKHPLIAGIVIGVFAVVFAIWIGTGFSRFFWVDLLVFVLPLLVCSALFILAHYNSIKPSPDKTTLIQQDADSPE